MRKSKQNLIQAGIDPMTVASFQNSVDESQIVVNQVQKPPKKGKITRNKDYAAMKADGTRLILKKGHQMQRPMGNIPLR